MDVAPCHWDLSYHRWTKQDAEVARAIKTIYPGAVSLVGKKIIPVLQCAGKTSTMIAAYLWRLFA